MAAGSATKEVTLPGFYHNLHSINHFHISETPWFKDLGLAERVTYITPRYEFGQAHRDGTALVFGRDLEETVANIARFSTRDAETFRDWNARAEEMTRQILIPERYAEPLPQAERDALLAQTPLGRDFYAVTQRQPLDLVEELFENEHVRLLFLFKVSLFGTWLTDTLSKTSPMGSVIRAFDLADRLPALPGRLVQPRARPDGDLHRGGRALSAAGRDRPHRDRRRPRHRHRARPTAAPCARASSWRRPSTCTRPSSR